MTKRTLGLRRDPCSLNWTDIVIFLAVLGPLRLEDDTNELFVEEAAE